VASHPLLGTRSPAVVGDEAKLCLFSHPSIVVFVFSVPTSLFSPSFTCPCLCFTDGHN
jgi:hypothetical protein